MAYKQQSNKRSEWAGLIHSAPTHWTRLFFARHRKKKKKEYTCISPVLTYKVVIFGYFPITTALTFFIKWSQQRTT